MKDKPSPAKKALGRITAIAAALSIALVIGIWISLREPVDLPYADGLWSGDAPSAEYTIEVQNWIREAGCSDEDKQCEQLAALRHTLRLPEGVSREPDCTANSVCVSEALSIRHDDLVAVLELVSPQIQPSWVNISVDDVMNGIVLVTAESDRGSTGGGIAYVDGGTFLVARDSPIDNWSILRGHVYTKDFFEVDED